MDGLSAAISTSMTRMTRLLRFWFTFEQPVGRGAYLRHGALLMLLKYVGDAALIGAATSTLWTPLDYVRSSPFALSARLGVVPASVLAPLLALWAFPFIWAGVTLTIRRLLDSGWSAWLSLLFFVPVLNYLLFAVLSVSPGRAGAPRPSEPQDPHAPKLPNALLSIAFGSAVGLAMIWLAVGLIDSYGLALFMGTPFFTGLFTGYTLCRRYPATSRETNEVVGLTMLLVTGAAFVTGIEGAVCLLMVAPLGVLVALLGAATGRFLARMRESPTQGAAFIAAFFPLALIVEGGPPTASLREVRSAVEIEAPAEVVWETVIAFPPITAPTALMFRLGIAYPMRAEIEGSGVGAIRLCVFSTGAFVEPITAWEPGRRLSFDVIESPPPLRELSFRDVKPPHLDGYLVPRRGEFRLVELPDGWTRLEGSTWYEQRLRPEGYWVVFSDFVIGRVHRRVLEHIKAVSEAAPRTRP
jgi:uncharacterized membrane protein YhaH (DUF805 family)